MSTVIVRHNKCREMLLQTVKQRLRRYSYSTHSRPPRMQHAFQSPRQRVHLDVDRTDNRKTGNKNFCELSKDNHPEIQLAFSRANSGKQLVRILQENENILDDCSLYNKAMSICDKRRDPSSARIIMQMLLSSKHTSPDLISFTTIVNIMARYDFPKLALEYFQTMITEYDIQPDIVIFGALFKSFKTRCEWQKASKMLEIMRNRFGIAPSEYIFAELLTIAAKAHKPQEGEALFDEYLSKVEQGELPVSKAVFGAYLHIFSECGDVDGLQRARTLNHEYGFKLDEVMVGKLMTGYIAAKEAEKCHEIYTEWIEQHNGSVNSILLGLRCVALTLQMERAASFDQRYKLFQELETVVFFESEEYGLEMDSVRIHTLLQGTILLYGNEKPAEIIPRFEYLVNEHWIKYSKYEKSVGRRVLDLHGFQPAICRFIIRYVFAFELDKYVKSEQDDLVIIVGEGQHVRGAAHRHGELRTFVEHELLCWDPVVRCKMDPNDQDCIVIEYQQLKPYLDNVYNSAKQKLMTTSNDWSNRTNTESTMPERKAIFSH